MSFAQFFILLVLAPSAGLFGDFEVVFLLSDDVPLCAPSPSFQFLEKPSFGFFSDNCVSHIFLFKARRASCSLRVGTLL